MIMQEGCVRTREGFFPRECLYL